jgi:transposase
MRMPNPSHPIPKVLGVDDWAYRKGHTYGTILVNLETRQPIDLLSDRTATTLAEWLQEHPGVEIISRDRAKAYKEGASRGCPEAIQVADRFHLLQNLAQMLEVVLNQHRTLLKAVRNGVTYQWSNGQVEGQVNRLKMLKRQMYGRASHELLKKRFLCPV